MIEVRNQSKI